MSGLGLFYLFFSSKDKSPCSVIELLGQYRKDKKSQVTLCTHPHLVCNLLLLYNISKLTTPPSSVPCPGDRVRQTENRETRCKVERLQLLMQQKRLRRKARRDQRAPYQWLPNRKAGRSNSNSSMSSEGSLDLDFEDSVWKPDVKADLKSEFVMA